MMCILLTTKELSKGSFGLSNRQLILSRTANQPTYISSIRQSLWTVRVHQPARTLPDYAKSQIGFYSDVDQALIDAADFDKPHNKYVALVRMKCLLKLI